MYAITRDRGAIWFCLLGGSPTAASSKGGSTGISSSSGAKGPVLGDSLCAPFLWFSTSSWPIVVGDQICLEHMESFHITKLAWKWELAVAVIYYHSTEGWPPVRFVCRASLHKHVCPHCKIHHPKWHLLRLLRRSWISPRDSLIRQNLEPSHARKTAGWGNSAFWVPLVLWIGQHLQSPGSSIQLESTLNETLWMLITRQSAVTGVIGGAQQHRHRGNLMMLTRSKNFSMGMVSVAAPAASQPSSVFQRKPIFVSLIVPAVNAEKMEAVGCCKATSFQWA